MEYQVKIDAFEGPLDLLLYLMKDMKISIDEINVSQITEQYLTFIHQMEKLNLEIASEYLVMAAHLVYIKSKMMLPKKEKVDNEEGYEENPEEKLKKRLKIYKLFKDLVPLFHELEEERSQYLMKIPTDLTQDIKLEVKEILNQDTDVYDLLSAFNRVLRRFMLHKPLKTKIEHQTITIEERILELRNFLIERQQVKFSELYQERIDKEYVVTTFMAILELAREKFLRISQGHLFDDIFLNYISESGEKHE
jgi:segregation and condensation protein A